jgi:hypothetical protein
VCELVAQIAVGGGRASRNKNATGPPKPSWSSDGVGEGSGGLLAASGGCLSPLATGYRCRRRDAENPEKMQLGRTNRLRAAWNSLLLD